jgi:Tfp pilus assembly protein PilE
MARGLTLLSLLATLVVVGWLLTSRGGDAPSRPQGSDAVERARQATAGVNFRQAEAELERAHSVNGTYAGVSLAGFGVTLVRADGSSYCMQTGTGATMTHVAGPGGAAAAGPC